MLTEDWMMRQVDAWPAHCFIWCFRRIPPTMCPYDRTAEDAALDELHRRLPIAATPGHRRGEDLLASDPGDRRYLELAVDFYARLNDLTDAQLEAGRLQPGRAGEACGYGDRFGVVTCCSQSEEERNEGRIRAMEETAIRQGGEE